jgi:hypothetical protein
MIRCLWNRSDGAVAGGANRASIPYTEISPIDFNPISIILRGGFSLANAIFWRFGGADAGTTGVFSGRAWVCEFF